MNSLLIISNSKDIRNPNPAEKNNVEVIEDIGIDGTSGVGKIKVYDEVWNAKSSNNCAIKVGEFVKITKIDSLTMYVEKIGEEKCSE